MNAIAKGVLISVISVSSIAVIGWMYSNYSPPKTEKEIEDINKNVTVLINNVNDKTVQDAIVKSNITQLIKGQEKQDMQNVRTDEKLDRITGLLIKIVSGKGNDLTKN